MDTHPKAQHVVQRKMEWKITLQDHTRNANIKKRRQIKDISHTAQDIKWRWARDVIRLDHIALCMQ